MLVGTLNLEIQDVIQICYAGHRFLHQQLLNAYVHILNLPFHVEVYIALLLVILNVIPNLNAFLLSDLVENDQEMQESEIEFKILVDQSVTAWVQLKDVQPALPLAMVAVFAVSGVALLANSAILANLAAVQLLDIKISFLTDELTSILIQAVP